MAEGFPGCLETRSAENLSLRRLRLVIDFTAQAAADSRAVLGFPVVRSRYLVSSPPSTPPSPVNADCSESGQLALASPMEANQASSFSSEVEARIDPGADSASVIRSLLRENTALRASELDYRQLVEQASDLIVKVDREGRFVFVSPAYCRLFGRSEAEMLGNRFMPLVHPDDHASTEQAMAQLGSPPHTCYLEQRAMTSQGWRHLCWSDTALVDAQGIVLQIIGVGRDITDQVEARQTLEIQRRQLATVVEMAQLGAWELDLAAGTVHLDSLAKSLLGMSDTSSPSIAQLRSACFEDELGMLHEQPKSLTSGDLPAYEAEFRFVLPTGQIRWLRARGNAVAQFPEGRPSLIVGVISDVTQARDAQDARRKVDERLREAQQFESLGVLASGIAHDFNNLLCGIMGNAELALLTRPDQLWGEHELVSIRTGAQRAAELCNQLLAFAGRSHIAPRTLNLNALIIELEPVLRVPLGTGINLVLQLAEDLPDLHADPAQLSQVLLNLVSNSADAIGDAAGVVAVVTRRAPAPTDRANTAQPGDASAAGFAGISLEVQDTGCGMPDAVKARAFEPFFTTKFAGRGLGLSAVLGIVRSHRGSVSVDSGPSGGTVVRVFLPVVSAPQAT